MELKCWKCQKSLGKAPKKLFFRAECDFCSAWLHVCKNCKHYSPGKHNDCEIPEADFIRDRESCNYCDYFQLKSEEKSNEAADPWKAASNLFGESVDPKENLSPEDRLKRLLGEDES